MSTIVEYFEWILERVVNREVMRIFCIVTYKRIIYILKQYMAIYRLAYLSMNAGAIEERTIHIREQP